MDWHVLLRRCPSRPVTAVGDLGSTAPLRAHLGDRWTHRVLTVNLSEGGKKIIGVEAEYNSSRVNP
jgi:hypothetical protein